MNTFKRVLPGVYHGRGKQPDRLRSKRTKSICVRLSDAEHQILSQMAKAAGLSISALLRDHLTRTRIYNHKQTQRWFATLLSIRNQLTVLVGKVATFQPVNAVVAIAYLAAIARYMGRLAQDEPQYARKVFPSRDSNE